MTTLMNAIRLFVCGVMAVCIGTANAEEPVLEDIAFRDIVVADFESTDYGDWKTTGSAFGDGPAAGTLPKQQQATGFQGERLVNTYLGGDGATGTLTSPAFKIERKHLNFLIGGGHHPKSAAIKLLVDGKVVRTATGPNRSGQNLGEGLASHSWDVAEFIDKQAVIEILDSATGGWGHINVDQIVQSNKAAPLDQRSKTSNEPEVFLHPTVELVIHRRHLTLPVEPEYAEQQLKLSVDGKELENVDFEECRIVCIGQHYETRLDLEEFHGAILRIEVLDDDAEVAESIEESHEQSNHPLGRYDRSRWRDGGYKTSSDADEDKLSYSSDILPLLSEKCFACHGPDAKNAESDLRLNDRENSVDMAAIVPGDPDDSEMIARMISDDPNLIMPPPGAHKQPFTAEETALIRRWIERGAEYEQHWSFVPFPKVSLAPTVPDISTPEDSQFGFHNHIDRFVLKKMNEHELVPNPPEAPHRLIRRLALDLTGLPPTPEMVQRYIANPTNREYKDIVDELLESHHFGEHWARHWLDAVRYADTHGIHFDNYRSIWPYRDWVVGALNSNMPFDQFTVEQMAGDMLPNATAEQRIASGYNRCLPTTNEGGVIDAEIEVNDANDRTATAFAVWQGLTVGCAACHDHKFDPISQEEYYSLTAFFRNSTVSPRDGNSSTHAPVLEAPNDIQQAEREQLNAERTKLEKSIAAAKVELETQISELSLDDKIARLKSASDGSGRVASVVTVPMYGDSPFGDFTATIDEAKFTETAADGLFGKTPAVSKDLTVGVTVNHQVDLKHGFAFGGFFRADKEAMKVLWSKMLCNQGNRGWEVLLQEKDFRVRLIDDDRYASVQVDVQRDISDEQWHHLIVSYDPAESHRPLTVFLDGESLDYKFTRESNDRLPRRASGASRLANHAKVFFGQRDRDNSGGDDARIQKGSVSVCDFGIYETPLSAADVERIRLQNLVVASNQIAADQLSEPHKSLLDQLFSQSANAELHAMTLRLADVKARLHKLKQEIPVSLVMQEKQKSLPVAHVLNRGHYASPGKQVGAGVPKVLPAFTESTPQNRLGLATWLVSPQNPLTARVTMNRYWHHLFGTGIVETTEDFGVTGKRPSHPELLDWLAQEFVGSDWDTKHMLRLMVTSSTYQQSQQATAEQRTADPENKWLARGPRIRLDGEQLRDMALANSGFLVDRVGGAPVFPYQPEDVWESVAMFVSDTRFYHQSQGENLYRRSLYTFWKRTAAPPSMTIMNAPDRDVFCVRRERTNTPLQAFVMLNDPQFVEAARGLAAKLTSESAELTDERFQRFADRVGRLYLSRAFNEQEQLILRETFDAAYDNFKSDPARVQEFLSVGESTVDESLDQTTVAAWTLVVSQIMNLDEALTK